MRPVYFNSLYQSKFKLLLLVLGLLTFNAHAQISASGCVSDDTGNLYPSPTGVTRSSTSGPAYNVTPVTSAAIVSGYCFPARGGRCVIRTKSDCSGCTGPYDYNPGSGKDMWYEQTGRMYTYLPCPIDDYAGLLVLAATGLGFVVLRKRLVC